MSFITVTGVLSAAVATGGTFTVGYPLGVSRGTIAQGVRHRISVAGRLLVCPNDFTVVFGATLATVTYTGATTLPAGTRFTAQFDSTGEVNDIVAPRTSIAIYTPAELAYVDLGSPTAAAAAGVCAAQANAGARDMTLVAGVNVWLGARTGRNVTCVSAGAGDTTQTITVRGFDMYGNAMTETLALNGTTPRAGVKAFYRVTRVSINAASAGNVSVGFGNVLGLPFFLPNSTFILREISNGAVAVAGTVVAGLSVQTVSTATTADVRGTYAPNAANDGSIGTALLVAGVDPTFLGNPQFAG